MGLPNYGAWYDSVKKGLFNSKVYLNGIDLSSNNWIHQSGIRGEALQYFNLDNNQIWNLEDLPMYSPFIWYKIIISHHEIRTLLHREGDIDSHDFISVALKMSSMGKGQLWVNGHALGRYWDVTSNSMCESCDYSGGFYDHKCLHNCGEPSQSYYHVPYDWLLDSKNQSQETEIVVFEEKGGNPKDIELVILL